MQILKKKDKPQRSDPMKIESFFMEILLFFFSIYMPVEKVGKSMQRARNTIKILISFMKFFSLNLRFHYDANERARVCQQTVLDGCCQPHRWSMSTMLSFVFHHILNMKTTLSAEILIK